MMFADCPARRAQDGAVPSSSRLQAGRKAALVSGRRRGQLYGLRRLPWAGLAVAVVMVAACAACSSGAAGQPSDLPRAFRTADLWPIHAADCCSRYSS
jgi:hypothetical protein